MSHLFYLALFTIAPLAGPVAWLTSTEHDFGDIPQGTPVEYVFRFQNTGAEPLVIDNVRASCGCTTPDWPRGAIAPDSTAAIRVAFSARTRGPFYKPVKLYFHGRRLAEKLIISGNVE